MNFRRMPFQFSATDPGARQRELEKRFGLPSREKMYVDVANPLLTNTVPKETCSPRLQHRVPIFAEGYDHPLNSSVDSMGSQLENKKPNVRVIPIEVEGAEKPGRHRTFSGPAGVARNENLAFERGEPSPLKRSIDELSEPFKIKSNQGPRVYNIPIQIEGENNSRSCIKTNKTLKTESPRVNGCPISKSANKAETTQNVQLETNKMQDDKEKNSVKNLLRKIEDVLIEFKKYEILVNAFSGTSEDKQYRYLDEMLTRCMLQLDNVDTMGNESVRLARKNAIKKVQASIDLLETKGNENKSSNVENEQTSEMSVSEESKSLDVNGIGITDVEMDTNKVTHEVKENITVLNGESKVCIETQEIKEVGDETMGQIDNSNCESGDKIDDVIEQIELAQIGSAISSNDVLNTVDIAKNIDTVTECQTNDIEMLDKNDRNSELSEVKTSLLLENASNNSEKTENISEGSTSQIERERQKGISEVEMAEIQVSLPADLNLENDKVEINNPDRNVPETMSEDISTCNAMQDVEMEEHPSNLSIATDEIKESSGQPSKQNITDCNPSQETVTNIKLETSTKDSKKINVDEVSEHSTVAK